MNLIINRQLDRAQKQVIYELTLKKRQSKKSTMSEKQVAARQQLALELMQERKVLPTDKLLQVNFADSLTTNDDQSLPEDQPSAGSIETSNSSGNASALISSCSSSSSCCFTRSDSSYSDSSQNSSAQLIDQLFLQTELQERKKEASIKFNKTRLEHLNVELERRLHQYEYLVAQEKALLGAYNVMLFTNEGVNNFHLYDAYANPARRLKNFHQQLKTNAQSNSAASSSTVSKPIIKTERPQLNSSASTVSNLNTLHMLPLLAPPRRSASSVALLNINQAQISD